MGKTTIYRWIAAHEADGSEALLPSRRPPLTGRKVYITRAWDAAVPFDDETKAAIRDKLDLRIRSLWAASPDYGWRWVADLAARYLAELTAEAGFDPAKANHDSLFRLGQLRVSKDGRKYRAVAIYDHDRKRWEDENRPRIRRTRATRRPMEIVFGDMHPMDLLLPRADGSTFTAKLAAFEDWATARMFVFPVFLGKGEGVRQEHIAAAIIAMTQELCWSLPETLYIDNGGEYGCAAMVADAMQLARRIRMLAGEAQSAAIGNGFEERSIVRAQPCNAAAKSIESAFARLEKGVFSMLPGHIGGDRMRKKTANIGREPVPYPHGREAFERDLRNTLTVYETKPQGGQMEDRSPRDACEAAVAEGWRAVTIEPEALLAAFARDASRVMGRDGFKWAGRTYRAPELDAVAAGTPLHLRVPIFSGTDAISVMRGEELLCVAWPDAAYDALDTAGARDAAGRHAAARRAVKAARGDTEPLDLRELLDRMAANAGGTPGRRKRD